jgi:predicted porin
VRVLPFVGYELGRSLRSPVQLGQDKMISRGLAGATFFFTYDQSEDSSFSFEVDYIRRFLLAREVSFTEDDDKKLIPVAIGKGPRDYLKATAEYDFSKYTGITFSYEYGKLPPNFELVNHKYSVGFVFKFQYKKK